MFQSWCISTGISSLCSTHTRYSFIHRCCFCMVLLSVVLMLVLSMYAWCECNCIRPILRVPNLAIHLNRGVNQDGFQFNQQTHVLPVLATAAKAYVTLHV